MLLDFEKYATKGNEFLHQLEVNLNTTDRTHASRILRSTFRVLRNHLTLRVVAITIAITYGKKGVYVDGWQKK